MEKENIFSSSSDEDESIVKTVGQNMLRQYVSHRSKGKKVSERLGTIAEEDVVLGEGDDDRVTEN